MTTDIAPFGSRPPSPALQLEDHGLDCLGRDQGELIASSRIALFSDCRGDTARLVKSARQSRAAARPSCRRNPNRSRVAAESPRGGSVPGQAPIDGRSERSVRRSTWSTPRRVIAGIMTAPTR